MTPDSTLERRLLAVPAADWVLDQNVVLDWYDGPVSGICRLLRPECCFRYELFADRPTGAGDDGLFWLVQVSDEATESLLRFLATIAEPQGRAWFPFGPRGSEVERSLDAQIGAVLESARPTRFVARMDRSVGLRAHDIWLVSRKDPAPPPVPERRSG